MIMRMMITTLRRIRPGLRRRRRVHRAATPEVVRARAFVPQAADVGACHVEAVELRLERELDGLEVDGRGAHAQVRVHAARSVGVAQRQPREHRRREGRGRAPLLITGREVGEKVGRAQRALYEWHRHQVDDPPQVAPHRRAPTRVQSPAIASDRALRVGEEGEQLVVDVRVAAGCARAEVRALLVREREEQLAADPRAGAAAAPAVGADERAGVQRDALIPCVGAVLVAVQAAGDAVVDPLLELAHDEHPDAQQHGAPPDGLGAQCLGRPCEVHASRLGHAGHRRAVKGRGDPTIGVIRSLVIIVVRQEVLVRAALAVP